MKPGLNIKPGLRIKPGLNIKPGLKIKPALNIKLGIDPWTFPQGLFFPPKNQKAGFIFKPGLYLNQVLF